jgi:hypothetical protein
MGKSKNFTARAARWSAAHRRLVVLGWLAFVIVLFALGSAAGMVQLTQVETENGQSRLADETQARQFPRERADEEVVIENSGGVLGGNGYRAAVTDLVRAARPRSRFLQAARCGAPAAAGGRLVPEQQRVSASREYDSPIALASRIGQRRPFTRAGVRVAADGDVGDNGGRSTDR